MEPTKLEQVQVNDCEELKLLRFVVSTADRFVSAMENNAPEFERNKAMYQFFGAVGAWRYTQTQQKHETEATP